MAQKAAGSEKRSAPRINLCGRIQAILACERNGSVVPCVCMAKKARTGVVGQDAFEPAFRLLRSVGHDDHPGMDRHADADPSAVMDAHPARSPRSEEHTS